MALGFVSSDAFVEDIFSMQGTIDLDSDNLYAEEGRAYGYQLEVVEEDFNVDKLQRLFEKLVNKIDILKARVDGLMLDSYDTAYVIFNYHRNSRTALWDAVFSCFAYTWLA